MVVEIFVLIVILIAFVFLSFCALENFASFISFISFYTFYQMEVVSISSVVWCIHGIIEGNKISEDLAILVRGKFSNILTTGKLAKCFKIAKIVALLKPNYLMILKTT